MMHLRTRSGALLLITVLIVGTVALSIAFSLSLRGIGQLDMGLSENKSLETLSIADGCAEEALLRLRRNSSYVGATLAVGNGICTITVTANVTERTIDVSATIDRWTRSIQVIAEVVGSTVTLTSWSQN